MKRNEAKQLTENDSFRTVFRQLANRPFHCCPYLIMCILEANSRSCWIFGTRTHTHSYRVVWRNNSRKYHISNDLFALFLFICARTWKAERVGRDFVKLVGIKWVECVRGCAENSMKYITSSFRGGKRWLKPVGKFFKMFLLVKRKRFAPNSNDEVLREESFCWSFCHIAA